MVIAALRIRVVTCRSESGGNISFLSTTHLVKLVAICVVCVSIRTSCGPQTRWRAGEGMFGAGVGVGVGSGSEFEFDVDACMTRPEPICGAGRGGRWDGKNGRKMSRVKHT